VNIVLMQGLIKGFVGPKNISSLCPFGDSKSIVETTVYSLLSEFMGGGGARIIDTHG
jgi:hypothetical protein